MYSVDLGPTHSGLTIEGAITRARLALDTMREGFNVDEVTFNFNDVLVRVNSQVTDQDVFLRYVSERH